MAPDDFDKRANALALDIERTIAEGEAFLNGLPEFEMRSERSRKLRRVRNQ